MRVAVLYLARHAEGLEPVRRFSDSYARWPAGITHDLVVLFKGSPNEASRRTAAELLPSHLAIDLPDIGFDIGAYATAALQIDHEAICCLNTFSEILAPNWLALLTAPLAADRVGIVGATASYESLSSSFRLYHYAIWLCAEGRISSHSRIASHYGHILRGPAPAWMQKADRVAAKSLRKRIWHRLTRDREIDAKLPRIIEGLRQRWETTDIESIRAIRGFPAFPNPHVRSNGFVVRRHDFLETAGDINDKMYAYGFESGSQSLSRRLMMRGQKALLVDRSGVDYEPSEWWKSRTFRLDNQIGLLIADNQTRKFEALTPRERAALVWMTWGDYVPPPRSLPRLGCEFPRSQDPFLAG